MTLLPSSAQRSSDVTGSSARSAPSSGSSAFSPRSESRRHGLPRL